MRGRADLKKEIVNFRGYCKNENTYTDSKRNSYCS